MKIIERLRAAATAFKAAPIETTPVHEQPLVEIYAYPTSEEIIVCQGEKYSDPHAAHVAIQSENIAAHGKRRMGTYLAAGAAGLAVADGIAFVKYGTGFKEYMFGGVSSAVLGIAAVRGGVGVGHHTKKINSLTVVRNVINKKIIAKAPKR